MNIFFHVKSVLPETSWNVVVFMNKMSSFNLINVVVFYKKCRRFRQQRSQLHQQAEMVEVKEKNFIDTSFVLVLVRQF